MLLTQDRRPETRKENVTRFNRENTTAYVRREVRSAAKRTTSLRPAAAEKRSGALIKFKYLRKGKEHALQHAPYPSSNWGWHADRKTRTLARKYSQLRHYKNRVVPVSRDTETEHNCSCLCALPLVFFSSLLSLQPSKSTCIENGDTKRETPQSVLFPKTSSSMTRPDRRIDPNDQRAHQQASQRPSARTKRKTFESDDARTSDVQSIEFAIYKPYDVMWNEKTAYGNLMRACASFIRSLMRREARCTGTAA